MVATANRAAGQDAGPAIADPYEVVSVRAVPAPSGMSGENWHCYKIRQGSNTIVGYRAGRTENVVTAVESIVLQLNERRTHKRGRVHVVLESRSRAAKRGS